MGKVWKYIDIFIGILIMFFIPSAALHTMARERKFDTCAARAWDYLALIQRQGYCTKELLDELSGIAKGVLGDVVIEIQYEPWQKEGGYRAVDSMNCMEYLGEEIYPFHTGDILRISVSMEYDGLEKLYFGFCSPAITGRFTVKTAMVRDGIYSRFPEK